MNSKTALFSTDIPQADNVYRLFEIVELVNKGRWRYVHFKHDLDITYRQGQYYKSATETLGLTSREYLTEAGEQFIELSELDKRIFMKDLILNSRAIKIYLKVRSEDKNETFLRFKKHIATGELSDSTIKRRITTLKAWVEYCEGLSAKLAIGRPNIITIEKDLSKLDAATQNHERLVKMMKNHLRSKKGTDVFEDRLVDLICIKRGVMTFFEMKSITDENKGNQLKKALGQLIFYKNLFGKNAELVVVLDKYFDDIDYLIDDPIHVIWREEDHFESDEKTKEKLKMVFN
jgi:hypothetical protein